MPRESRESTRAAAVEKPSESATPDLGKASSQHQALAQSEKGAAHQAQDRQAEDLAGRIELKEVDSRAGEQPPHLLEQDHARCQPDAEPDGGGQDPRGRTNRGSRPERKPLSGPKHSADQRREHGRDEHHPHDGFERPTQNERSRDSRRQPDRRQDDPLSAVRHVESSWSAERMRSPDVNSTA